MNSVTFSNGWLQQLNASAAQAPISARLPLLLANAAIGSVDDAYFCNIVLDRPDQFRPWLYRSVASSGAAWHVRGDASFALDSLAKALRSTESSGVAAQWRNEMLAVRGADGGVVGQIERGAVRALGIATRAVHLVGCDEGGQVWIQQRSLNKSTDPGLWDTLMGGMISFADTLQSALERETWEEAGIRLESVRHLHGGGKVWLNKPNPRDGGVGYIEECIDWFGCVVPNGIHPVNQDGEVERFALVNVPELQRMLESNAFTTEAALILVQHLRAMSADAAAPAG
ncbi:MAG: NUDIX domain-containing protein [Rhodoferax sp.]|nr:NUDIX domain-containing protein [Rhodoferax sp.]